MTSGGMVAIAWHRWNLANKSHIQFVRSDGTSAGFAAATTVDVTTGPSFDRFAHVVHFAPDARRPAHTSGRRTPSFDELLAHPGRAR